MCGQVCRTRLSNALGLRPLRLGGAIAIVSKRGGRRVQCEAAEASMVQTTNRFFDEVARLMNDAAGVAQGVRREFETLFRNQADRFLRDLDVVKREEFEAVKEMARIAREDNEALKARVAALEARLSQLTPVTGPAAEPGPSPNIDRPAL
jgi:BMFP domain-containing protein YqiC